MNETVKTVITVAAGVVVGIGITKVARIIKNRKEEKKSK